jgi:acetyltransferase-like isoleucine patch superfamily enzyme
VTGGLGLAAVRVVNYLTNHLVNHIPSYRLRHAWYRALGLSIGPGSGVHLNCYVWFFGPGQVRRTGARVGANTRVNRGCCLDVRGPLLIGDNVSISPEVAIVTTQHDLAAADFRLQSRPVVIEDHVWIGMRATILPGSTIGRGAVVAAGAVVAGAVPPLSVVGGIPARPIGRRPAGALGYTLDPPLSALE